MKYTVDEKYIARVSQIKCNALTSIKKFKDCGVSIDPIYTNALIKYMWDLIVKMEACNQKRDEENLRSLITSFHQHLTTLEATETHISFFTQLMQLFIDLMFENHTPTELAEYVKRAGFHPDSVYRRLRMELLSLGDPDGISFRSMLDKKTSFVNLLAGGRSNSTGTLVDSPASTGSFSESQESLPPSDMSDFSGSQGNSLPSDTSGFSESQEDSPISDTSNFSGSQEDSPFTDVIEDEPLPVAMQVLDTLKRPHGIQEFDQPGPSKRLALSEPIQNKNIGTTRRVSASLPQHLIGVLHRTPTLYGEGASRRDHLTQFSPLFKAPRIPAEHQAPPGLRFSRKGTWLVGPTEDDAAEGLPVALPSSVSARR